ncbi:MAG: TatD family hydrolase [Candidatus Azambacteria bacterium]|nr:TatD family hydrolase [Candidatus Azambacteria bacterium]
MLIDSHTHVNFKDFDDDRDAVIKRCLDENIWMITVGTNAMHSKKTVEMAHTYPEGVYAAVGIHPHDSGATEEFSVIERLAEDAKVVAIGETGLDYFRIEKGEESIKKQQQELFIKHIELAQRIKKTLIIHCRDAHDDLIRILTEHGKGSDGQRKGVMHFFTGTQEYAKNYLDLGFYISFSGVLTFTHDYDELVRMIPMDRILIETDAPFVAPVPHRGKRNEPSYVKYTAQRIAEIKGLSFEGVAMQTTQNSRELFVI